MKSFTLYAAILLCAASPVLSHAQSVERPKPGFTLSIEESSLHRPPCILGHLSSDTHALCVTYTNTSDAVQTDWADGIDSENMLNMVVLRDGLLMEGAKTLEDLRDSREARRTGPKPGHSFSMDIHGPIKPLKPGESVTFPLYLSYYFDMSKPATYSVTVNRETFPWEPAKSVTVWSNTITIVVPSDNRPAEEDQ